MTVHHLVLLRYDSDADAATRQEVHARLLALKDDCLRNGEPYITSLTGGHQNSREPAADRWDDGFVMTFASTDDRDYYIGLDPADADPVHRAFVEFASPHLDDVAVVDFAADDR